MWEWLRVHIDPMHRVLRADEAEAASWLCYAESLLSGTTTVVDMWRYMDGAAGGRIDVWVGLEHPFYADAAGMRRAIAMARDYGTGRYTHCSESRIELPEFERRYGERPMFALESLGSSPRPRR